MDRVSLPAEDGARAGPSAVDQRVDLHGDDDDDSDLIAVLDPVHEACLYIQDALHHTTHSHPLKGETPRRLHLVHLAMKPFVYALLVSLVLLCFFEMPAWCATDPACEASLTDGRLTGNYSSGEFLFGPFGANWTTTSSDDYLAVQHAATYPLFGIPILPQWSCALIEFFIYFFLAIELGCNMGAQGRRRYFFKGARTEGVYAVCFALSLIDALARCFSPWPAGYLSPYLRVVLMCVKSPAILHELWSATL